MSYVLLLLYSIIFYLSSVRLKWNKSSTQDKSENEEGTSQSKVEMASEMKSSGRNIIIYLLTGLVLGTGSLTTFILYGRESIPDFMRQGFILSYLVISEVVILVLFVVTMQCRKKPN